MTKKNKIITRSKDRLGYQGIKGNFKTFITSLVAFVRVDDSAINIFLFFNCKELSLFVFLVLYYF